MLQKQKMNCVELNQLDLSPFCSEGEIRREFERHGRVGAVRMATDRGTGTACGFGFVNMLRIADAEEAISRLNGQSIGGRAITVNEAGA